MSNPKHLGHPDTPFPIGVEYYRGPTPKRDCWDQDFARIAGAGFRIVRSHSYWNWMEPRPGQYELDDFDLMVDLTEKHGLKAWLDIMLSTHGACPEWLTREHPDIRVVTYRGQRVEASARPAYPQGAVIHCYDHPAWREYGGALLRHVVRRYKDRPGLLIWGLWDGIGMPSAWSPIADGYPCYCEHTIARYKGWLRERFTLESLNQRTLRRYRRWEDVEPPRSNHNVVEMLLYRQFHYENLADQLRWMVDEVEHIDPNHEVRAHGAWYPRPWDEGCAQHVDSWGMSMPSNNVLTAQDPCKIAERAFSFDWSRGVGRHGRWWHEEIYAGMAPGGVVWQKQSDPRELTMLLWMTLAGGAAGAMFWQYRPEYLSFESPGYNLVALDGEPTLRFHAAARAVQQIDRLAPHLPLVCPRAHVAVVYHPQSQELFTYGEESGRFLADLRGVYRTLWTSGVPADIVTPRMDWTGYRLVFLPNVALMDDATRERIERTLAASPDTHFVAEGSFGLYSADGQSSYQPPEGFAERFGIRVADFSRVSEHDISRGANVVETAYGLVVATSSFGYAVLEPRGGTRAIATIDGATVAIQTADRRFTWFGFTLSAGFGDVGQPHLVQSLLHEFGVSAPVQMAGDQVVPVARRSAQGGWLLFLFNLEERAARCEVRPRWPLRRAADLLTRVQLPVQDGSFSLALEAREVGVLHCATV